jgi:exosortase
MGSNFFKQWSVFFALAALSVLAALGPGRYLLSFAYHTGDQSYILLVPVLCGMLLYRDGVRIFSETTTGRNTASTIAFLSGLILIAVAYATPAASELQMVLTGLGLVACWAGAFLYSFGTKAGRAAAFPLAMLLWIVPIPAAIVESFRYFLQVGSTECVNIMFKLTGIPVLRDGFVFHLPTQSIEVAKECSGIRSSLCLILLTLVIGHETLRGNINRGILLLSTVPIVILKNGVRIVTLTLGAIYIDPSFLTGPLHHEGGIVFFLIGMLMLIPVIWFLRHWEPKTAPAPISEQTAIAGK